MKRSFGCDISNTHQGLVKKITPFKIINERKSNHHFSEENTTKETKNLFDLPNFSSSSSSLGSDSTPKRSNVSFNHPILYFDGDDYEETKTQTITTSNNINFYHVLLHSLENVILSLLMSNGYPILVNNASIHFHSCCTRIL